MHFITHILGLDSTTGSFYLFWSGVGGDMGDFALIGAIFKTAINLRKQHERHHKELMITLTDKNNN